MIYFVAVFILLYLIPLCFSRSAKRSAKEAALITGGTAIMLSLLMTPIFLFGGALAGELDLLGFLLAIGHVLMPAPIAWIIWCAGILVHRSR